MRAREIQREHGIVERYKYLDVIIYTSNGQFNRIATNMKEKSVDK